MMLPYVTLLLTGAFDRAAAHLAPRSVAFDHECSMGSDRDTGTRLLHLEVEGHLAGGAPGAATLPMLQGAGRVEGGGVAAPRARQAGGRGLTRYAVHGGMTTRAS